MKSKLFILTSLAFALHSCSENNDEKKEKEAVKEETADTTESSMQQNYEVNEVNVSSDWIVSITSKQIPVSEIANVLGSSYGTIFPILMEANVEIGIPRAYSHNWVDINTPFDLEAALPVNDSTIKVNEPMKLRKTYSGKALKVVYFGAYENMHNAYMEIEKYMTTNKLESNGSPWEVYIGDPGVETDPNKIQTDIYMPVK